jgi:hypothetical protein
MLDLQLRNRVFYGAGRSSFSLLMAQQHLDRTNVGAALHKVCGEKKRGRS